MHNNFSPVIQQERSNILDVLRGIALLGICLANYPFFAMYVFQPPAVQASMPTATVDTVIKYLQAALIDGKFYSMFCLGLGLLLTCKKLQKAANKV